MPLVKSIQLWIFELKKILFYIYSLTENSDSLLDFGYTFWYLLVYNLFIFLIKFGFSNISVYRITKETFLVKMRIHFRKKWCSKWRLVVWIHPITYFTYTKQKKTFHYANRYTFFYLVQSTSLASITINYYHSLAIQNHLSL